jgi:UDP-N-acetylmuramoylalanine--D-glutamate ligase
MCPRTLPALVEARRRGVRVIGEVELAAPFLKGETIGITGSNGKTTTTSLIGHILGEAGVPVQVGGNIGTPVTAMVESSRADGWNVLELSSFQLETIAEFRAHIGLALNVTQNHLDRHHTFENYAAAKGRLFETQRSGDFAVLNAEDPVCVGYADGTLATAQWFSSRREVSPGASLRGDDVVLDGRVLMEAGEIPLRGRHNVENVLAAAIAAARAGVKPEAIAAAVRTFQAVEHRLEFVRTVSGIDFYNDSKATSVDATLKALDAFPGGLWVILGGKDKGSGLLAVARAAGGQGARGAADRRGGGEKIAGQLAGGRAAGGFEDAGAAVAHASHGPAGRHGAAGAGVRQLRPIQELRASRRGFQTNRQPTTSPRIDMAQRLKTDWILFVTVLAMVSFGLLMLYSASSIMAQMDPRYGSSWHFVCARWSGRPWRWSS